MNYIVQSINSVSGYRWQNTSNLYNFIYDVIQMSNEEDRQIIIESLKKNMGNTVYDEFHYYIVRKKLDSSFID